MKVRISLDVTQGTFTQIEALCREEYRNKVDYLRMLVDNDLKERKQ